MEPVKTGLIQRVEDEFGISVSDGEALRVRTAGDLHVLVARKLNRKDSLLFLRALYLTRRALADGLEVPRQTIDSATRLAELLPQAGRVDRWNTIARSAGGQFPHLHHSRQWTDRVMLASMAIAAVPVIALWWALYALDWIRGIGMLLFSMPAALAFLLLESRVDKHLLLATARRANELPCETVRELAQKVLEMNPPVLHSAPADGKAPSSEDVWVRLAGLIREYWGGEPGEIAFETAIPEPEKVH